MFRCISFHPGNLTCTAVILTCGLINEHVANSQCAAPGSTGGWQVKGSGNESTARCKQPSRTLHHTSPTAVTGATAMRPASAAVEADAAHHTTRLAAVCREMLSGWSSANTRAMLSTLSGCAPGSRRLAACAAAFGARKGKGLRNQRTAAAQIWHSHSTNSMTMWLVEAALTPLMPQHLSDGQLGVHYRACSGTWRCESMDNGCRDRM